MRVITRTTFKFINMKIINPILPIMDTILGDLTSLQAEGKITHQTIERVALQWYESERNILRKTTNTGARSRLSPTQRRATFKAR